MKIEKQNPGFAKRVKSWLTGKYVENGSTASQNIPAGKWVTWKGRVCWSKTAITAGDTLSSANLDTDEEGALNSNSLTYHVDENVVGGYIVGYGNILIIGARVWNPSNTGEWFHALPVYYPYDNSTRIQIFNSSMSSSLSSGGFTVEYWTIERPSS